MAQSPHSWTNFLTRGVQFTFLNQRSPLLPHHKESKLHKTDPTLVLLAKEDALSAKGLGHTAVDYPNRNIVTLAEWEVMK